MWPPGLVIRTSSSKALAGPPCECRIEENTILGGDDDGVDLFNSSAIVRGNFILGVADRAISIEGPGTPRIEGNVIAGAAGGIALKDGTTAVGAHNTVTRCLIGLHLFVKNPGAPGGRGTFHSSILWGNDRDVVLDTDSSLALDHCDVGLEPERWGAGNFSADPLLASLEDFRLRSGSPCEGSGRDGTVVGALSVLAAPQPEIGSPQVQALLERVFGRDPVVRRGVCAHEVCRTAMVGRDAERSERLTYCPVLAKHDAHRLVGSEGERPHDQGRAHYESPPRREPRGERFDRENCEHEHRTEGV